MKFPMVFAMGAAVLLIPLHGFKIPKEAKNLAELEEVCAEASKKPKLVAFVISQKVMKET